MKKRCNGCMRLKGSELRCGFCGYLETDQNSGHQLPVNTVLHEQYRIGRVLGQGGFGITYLGWDSKLEIPVAVKEYYPNSQVSRPQGSTLVVTLQDNVRSYQEGKDRFLKEARTLAKLRQQYHIVQIHNFFAENNTAYIVMEYVEGQTLKEYVRSQGGKLPARQVLDIIRPILHAMEQVHQAGMIHRDISPENIMVQTDGTVKILDFGTARDMEAGQLTHSTQAVLKRGYAPMEQYSAGRAIDQRADVYALCATIYYCLTGVRPMDALDRLMDRASIPWEKIPGLTPEQTAALEKGTALRAEDRFQDLAQLELALFGSTAPAQPKKKPTPMPAQRWSLDEDATMLSPKQEVAQTQLLNAPKKSRGPRVLLAAGILILAGAGAWLVRLQSQYNQAQTALAEQDFSAAYAAFSDLGGYRDSQEMLSQVRYQEGHWYLTSGEYQSAYDTFAALGDYQDSRELCSQVRYQEGLSLMTDQEYRQAYPIFKSISGYQDSQAQMAAIREALIQPRTIAAGAHYTIGLKTDGSVITVGSNIHGALETDAWEDIVALDAAYHTVGLKADGTVVAVGFDKDDRCGVSQWEDIVAVAASYHTVGLKADGTVVATGYNGSGQCNVSSWQDITAVDAGYHTVGLKTDGTVAATGGNAYGQCSVSSWQDITAVAAGRNHTVGLKNDGTVVATGYNAYGQCDVSGWQNIVAIAAGWNHTVGLKADGTVVVAGSNSDGQRSADRWKDIVAIAAEGNHTVGLKADGTAVAAGSNADGQCSIASWNGWKDLQLPK